ncbi:RsmB/NOP family class I SAM-dependent RNA methyltransferase [Merdibacter massiliensis]|uniref:RsmB/NOP family class I SAM-dependent RNA methyltransferase n=1 Tax=Merdibacter massiliensis TaxID=1871030 RepID=UPI00096A42EA|nr:RsmB/NOP family class I SAM-dependent RNA methyltransferase [Merdibacter massiliensis]
MKEAFLNRMKLYLKDEYDAYVESLQQPRFRGLRINETRCSIEHFLSISPWECTPSVICPQSFYIKEEHIGNHPLHLSGVFYLQEPSASSAVEVLDVQEGEWILDLCAAPGGKSTQIASKLRHTGFLLSNEIEFKRAMILLSNMERLGFSEYAITNERPQKIAAALPACFDKVLVDAPCSGEGMFKKHEQAIEDWSEEQVAFCAQRQREILRSAYETLRPGGIMVYSTCTYAKEENEETIAAFLQEFPDMELIDCGVSFGRIGFSGCGIDAAKVRRIFPMDGGEGHFIAKLQKRGDQQRTSIKTMKSSTIDPLALHFFKDQLTQQDPYLLQQKEKVFARRQPFLSLGKLNVIRQGILCGEIVKKRFEPHQHFYMASIHQEGLRHTYDMDIAKCEQFLKGHPIMAEAKGFLCMRYEGFPLGYGKGDGTWIKNRYPKGMRMSEQVKLC